MVRKKRSQALSVVKHMDVYIKALDTNYWILPIAMRDVIWKKAMHMLETDLEPLTVEKKRKIKVDDMVYSSMYENYLTKLHKQPKH